MVTLITLICIIFLTFCPNFIKADQVRGVIVDPNAPRPPEVTTPETIFFLTTQNEDNLDFTTPQSPRGSGRGQPETSGKWVRRTTELPVYERTTENPYERPTEEPFGPDDRQFGRTTYKYKPFRVTTPQDGDRDGDETTEDPYAQRYATTDRFSRRGSRTTERPYRVTTPGDGDGGETTEDIFSLRYTTDRNSRYGSRTTADPFDRRLSLTTRYAPFGRVTTPSDGDEETATDDRYQGRYTTYRPFLGRRTTEDYSPIDERTTVGYPIFGRRTTESSRPDRFRFTTSPYDRYKPFGRETTIRHFGPTEREVGGDPNASCQLSTGNSFEFGKNVCEEYVGCCKRFCERTRLIAKAGCSHDTERGGFQRAATFCNCKEPRDTRLFERE